MPKKRTDTYSHYNKDPKKLDKKMKELRSGDSRGGYQSPKKLRSGDYQSPKRAGYTQLKNRRGDYQSPKSSMTSNKMPSTRIADDEFSFKFEGRNAVIELLKSNREINKVLIAKGDRQGSINEIISLCKDKGIIFQEVERAKLDELSETGHHQGVIAYASPVEYKEVQDILDIAKQRKEAPFIVICDEIEDPHNLGALIRTAEIAGCHGIIIPKRRSASVTETVVKVSCGATEHLAIARVGNINDAIDELKEAGVWVYGTDGSADRLYFEEDFKGPTAIIIGSEGRGMNKLTMKKCDVLLKIPMKGHITSLNASVSGGIVIFEVVKQRL